ncbi:MAG: BatA domain-containing protein [Candidatus Kapaibacterium sp.]
MTFLNPLVLLGLAAASIPLLLHLLNLRKLRTVPFSTLRFLKEIEKTQIRSLKLQQLLLLLLRTLIVVCAVLAFARPVLQTSVPVVGGHIPSSVIIVLDNSYSMDASDDRGNRFQQARRAALSICDALKDGDEVAVLTSSMVGSRTKAGFVRTVQTVRERLQREETAPRTAQLSAMLAQAAALVGEAKNYHREVYVITDVQSNVLGPAGDTAMWALGNASVYLIPIGANSRTNGQNLSVDSVALTTAIFQPGSPVSVEARVRNTGASAATGVVVRMMMNGVAVAQRSIDIPAGSVRSVGLTAPATDRGVVRGSVEIEGDAIASDNVRWFAFHIPPAPNVVLVTGEAKGAFIRAVSGLEESKGLFAMRTVRTADLGSIDLERTDVIMLTETVPPAQQERLFAYVERGGALVVFASGADAEQSGFLARLGLGAITETTFAAGEPGAFATTDKTHPLFSGVFSASTQRGLVESPKIYRAYPCSGGQPIITMARGSFLAENTVGQGRVLYCAVAPDLQASSFPLTGLFPVTILRSIPYTRHREQALSSILCGESGVITLPARASAASGVRVVDPTGAVSVRSVAVMPSASVLDPGALVTPGVTVVKAMDGTDITAITVNAPAEESLADYMEPQRLRESMNKRLPESAQTQMLDPLGRIADTVARERTGTELWRLFVVLAIAFALAEMVVARRTVVATA